MSELHFYYMDASAPSRGAWTVLELLGLKYTEHYINLIAGEHKEDSYAKVNPLQRVPALIDGDINLSESRVVATYLVNKYGAKCGKQDLYPTDPGQRALVDKHLYIGVDVLDVVNSYVNVQGVMLDGGLMDESKLGNLEKHLAMVESFLANSPYTAANHLTLADIFYFIAIHLITLTDYNGWNKYPKIVEWRKRIETIPCYEKTLGTPVANLRAPFQQALEANSKKK